MEHHLTDLIHSYGNTSGVSAASYSTLSGIRNKFNVPVSKFGEFIDTYCRLAYDDEQADEGDGNPPTSLYIGELIEGKSTLPLMGNFLFKFEVDEGEEERSYYTEELILKIVYAYQKAILELLDTSVQLSELICCVMEGHSYRKGGNVLINVLIQFPFCQVDTRFMKRTFRNHIEKQLRSARVSESFETPLVGDWRDVIIDIDNVVPMYRSTLESNAPHLALTHVYGKVEEDHIASMMGPDMRLMDVFEPSKHSFIYNGKVPRGSVPLEPAEDEDEEEFRRYLLPLFLSIHFWPGQTNPKEVEKSSMESKRNVYDVEDMESDNPIRISMSLLPLLSVDRANKDYSWLDIGRAIYSIYNGSDEGLSAWIAFSNRATVPGRDKDTCKYKWRSLREANLISVKTIAWYAKEDNPPAYQDWHIAWCQRSLNDALSGTHTDVAKAVYRVFWLEYIYSGDSKMWYDFRVNHFYRLGVQPVPLRRQISERVVFIFDKMKFELGKVSIEEATKSDDFAKKDADFRTKAIIELNKKLKNEGYRSTIIKSVSDLFHVEEFEKKCDKNHFLTAVGNCILEVVDKRVRPRKGKPEDYILKYSDIHYPFDFTWESQPVRDALYWFDQICVRDQGLKHYFLKRLASFLRGLNPEKLFDVYSGATGNNSKSILIKTLQYIFGAYFVDFPTSLLSGNGKQNSGSANPELAQAANARAAILAEPDDREVMKGGIIKRITGGDRIFTRGLHENGGSMDLTFKTIMVCNRIPDIANVDKALINRFVIIPFLGTWCDDAPETEDEQFRQRKFKIDYNFDAKIPALAQGLLWVMVQYYQHYANEGLAFPDIVKEYIKRHWEDNDYYLQFIAEKLEYAYKDADKKEINTGASLSVQDMYQIFSRWFKDYYPGLSVPTANQVKADMEMTGRLGPQPKRGQWLGIQIKQSALVANLAGGGIANI